MIRLGIRADNWRCLSGSLEQAVEATKRLGVEEIEFGSTNGQEAVVALGFGPTVSLDSNPIKLLKEADWDGGVSIECLGTDEMLSASVSWVREQIASA